MFDLVGFYHLERLYNLQAMFYFAKYLMKISV